MAKVNPQQAAEKWGRRLKAATADIQAGVERVQVAPGELAAAKADKMRANLLAKIDDGTWAQRVASVSLADWKQRTINKGIPRINAGVDAATAKQVAFFTQLFEYQERVSTEINQMPDLTLSDNIARMVHQVQRMSEFRKK
jgi:hypothetical protein